jgi:hypothetical protein
MAAHAEGGAGAGETRGGAGEGLASARKTSAGAWETRASALAGRASAREGRVTSAHAVLGAVVTALFAGAGGLGAWRWWRVEQSPWFWRLLRAGQLLLVVEVALGGVLLATGRRPSATLHYVYGLLPLVVGFAAEQLRLAAADTVLAARKLDSADAVGALSAAEQRSVAVAILRRELGAMALGALVSAALLIRAATVT